MELQPPKNYLLKILCFSTRNNIKNNAFSPVAIPGYGSFFIHFSNKLKQKPSIYRHDVSDPDLNPIFFIFGFIFAILGSLFADFHFTK